MGISREAIEMIQGGWEVGVTWGSIGRLLRGYRVAGKWESYFHSDPLILTTDPESPQV